MLDYIKRIFRLRGSWGWAVRQMRKGLVVYRTTDTGYARYRYSVDGCRRMEWAFKRDIEPDDWSNAYIFDNDFTCVNWAVSIEI